VRRREHLEGGNAGPLELVERRNYTRAIERESWALFASRADTRNCRRRFPPPRRQVAPLAFDISGEEARDRCHQGDRPRRG
jgi:hypothetical protein